MMCLHSHSVTSESLLLVLLTHCLVSQSLSQTLSGVTGSGDNGRGYSYVYVGDRLQLNCTVNSSHGWQATDLIFSRENYFDDGYVTLPQSEVTVISNRTAQLNHEVQGKQDAGEYSCWIKTAQDYFLVDEQQVYVQYLPQKPSSLSCEVKDWDVRLTCSWDYGVQYVNNSAFSDLQTPDVSVQVMMFIRKDVYPFSSDDICGQPMSVYNGSSQCVLLDDQFRAPPKYVWRVVVINKITNDMNMTYLPIINMDIVKPSRASHIWAEYVNSTCVSLAWNHTHSKYRQMFYRVNISAGISKLEYKNSAQFCGLEPYTQYTVSVECRPYNLDENQPHGFWSDAKSHNVTTEESVPDSSFPVDSGSYLLGPCKDGIRNITIFLKEVPPSKRNGEIIGYQLRYNGTSVDVNVTSPMSAVVPSITCGANFSVRIFSRTKVGPSKTNSKLYIYSDKGKPVAEFAVQVLGKGVRVVWNNTGDTNETVITVFWCPQDKTTLDRTCKGEIQSVSSPFTAGQVDIPQLVNPHDYLFGVSRDAHGISWASCYYQSRALMKAPEMRVKAVGGLLDVEWRAQQCSDHYPVHTTGYRLYYCQPQHCHNPPQVVEVKGVERNHYSIKGEPGVTYNITMQAVDFSGRLGPLSPPHIEAIPVSEVSFPLWGKILIIILTVAIVGIITGCILISRRRIRREAGKFGKNIEWRIQSEGTAEGGTYMHLPTSSPPTRCSSASPLAQRDSVEEETGCKITTPDQPQATLRDAYCPVPPNMPPTPCHYDAALIEDKVSTSHIPLATLDRTEAAAGSDETKLSPVMSDLTPVPGIVPCVPEASSGVGGQVDTVMATVHMPNNVSGFYLDRPHNGGGAISLHNITGSNEIVLESFIGQGDDAFNCFDSATTSSYTESDVVMGGNELSADGLPGADLFLKTSAILQDSSNPLNEEGRPVDAAVQDAKTGNKQNGYKTLPAIPGTGQSPSPLPVSHGIDERNAQQTVAFRGLERREKQNSTLGYVCSFPPGGV